MQQGPEAATRGHRPTGGLSDLSVGGGKTGNAAAAAEENSTDAAIASTPFPEQSSELGVSPDAQNLLSIDPLQPTRGELAEAGASAPSPGPSPSTSQGLTSLEESTPGRPNLNGIGPQDRSQEVVFDAGSQAAASGSGLIHSKERQSTTKNYDGAIASEISADQIPGISEAGAKAKRGVGVVV